MTFPSEEDRLRALKAGVVSDLRREAQDLHERAASLERRAEVIERTWGLENAGELVDMPPFSQ